MSEGETESIRRVGRRRGIDVEKAADHVLHLPFVGRAIARNSQLHLTGRVLGDLASELRRGQQGDPGGLTNGHRRARVRIEEHPLHGYSVRRMLVDQSSHLVVQCGQALRDGGPASTDGAVHDGPDGPGRVVNEAEPGTGQAGVQPQDAHRTRLRGPGDSGEELGPDSGTMTSMKRLRRWWPMFVLVAGVFAVYALSRNADNPYEQYVLLTDAFLHGRLHLIDPPDFLEVATFSGRAYVIDPPAPTLFLMPVVAIFGTGANHVLVSAGVGAAAVGFIWSAARRMWPDAIFAIAMALFVAFGTNLWWAASDGGFWPFAHVSAVVFLAAGLAEGVGRRRPWLVGLCVGLAGLSRLPVFLLTPLFAYLVLDGDLRLRRRNIERLAWFGAFVGLAAAGYIAYNLARYGTITDAGYYHPQYASEPWFQKGRFDLTYIPRHIQAMVFEPPRLVENFPFFKPSFIGLALIFATPAYLFAFRTRLTARNVAALIALVVTAIPIVLHGTTGWAQFGYRFSLDLLPPLLLLTASGMRERLTPRRIAVLALCVLVNLWGVLSFNVFDFIAH